MLGELIAIFHTIVRCIAWNVLPRAQFVKLFNGDLQLSILFGNFLLAEKILKQFDCDVICYPPLPKTYLDYLWKLWLQILKEKLSDLPEILEGTKRYKCVDFFPIELNEFCKSEAESSIYYDILPVFQYGLVTSNTRSTALDCIESYSRHSKEYSRN
ncbi:MAG: hypothetical protein MHPSP_002276, partial [Paramarteilia canceri]